MLCCSCSALSSYIRIATPHIWVLAINANLISTTEKPVIEERHCQQYCIAEDFHPFYWQGRSRGPTYNLPWWLVVPTTNRNQMLPLSYHGGSSGLITNTWETWTCFKWWEDTTLMMRVTIVNLKMKNCIWWKKPPRSTSTLICSVNANMKNYILKKVLPLLDKIRGLYCHLYILHIRLLCINKNIWITHE